MREEGREGGGRDRILYIRGSIEGHGHAPFCVGISPKGIGVCGAEKCLFTGERHDACAEELSEGGRVCSTEYQNVCSVQTPKSSEARIPLELSQEAL